MSKLDGLDKGYEDMFAPIVEFKDEVEELSEFLDKRDINSQYKHGDIEPLDIAKEQGWFEGYCRTCINKYNMRRKGQTINDLRKIIDYAERLIDWYEEK